MKHILCAVFLALTSTCFAWGQEGLHINDVFDLFHDNEIVVKGAAADSLGLTLYRSIVADDPEACVQIINAITHDGAQAIDKDVIYQNEHIYYGFYTFSPTNNPKRPRQRLNRYVFLLDRRHEVEPVNKVTLVYVETDLNARCVKRIFIKQPKR